MIVASPYPWRAVVQTVLARQTGTVVDATAFLWERLSPELRLILGDGAFKPLFSRSLHMTSRNYAWLLEDEENSVGGDVVSKLTTALQGQRASVAKEASTALFVGFLELLASLIGDELTVRILRAAWGQWISEL